MQGKLRDDVAEGIRYVLKIPGLSDAERNEAYDIWADYNRPFSATLGFQIATKKEIQGLENKVLARIKSEPKP